MKDKFPVKNQSIDGYMRVKKHQTSSFHQIFELVKKYDQAHCPCKAATDLDREDIINQEEFVVIEATKYSFYYFFKQNDTGSLISPLEAMCWGFYQLLMPDLVSSKTIAHYNSEGCYVGVSSKAILGFKSVMEEPLKKDDLIIEPLADLIVSLEFVDVEKEENKNDSILFYIEDLDQMDQKLHPRQNGVINEYPEEKMMTYTSTFTHAELKLTAKDLKKYRLIKGLAIGLVTSYFFEEDDLHRGNLSKEGKRIDFDMSLWPINCIFKGDKVFIDKIIRLPHDKTFLITKDNIRHFPNMTKETQPHYWPTKVISITDHFTSSKNTFPSEERLIYRELEKHPVFIYHKYAQLLKHILIPLEAYRCIAELHLDSKIKFEKQNKLIHFFTVGYQDRGIIDVIIEHIGNRMDALLQCLMQLSEFKAFLINHGQYALQRIREELKHRNQVLEKKIVKLNADLSALNEKANHVNDEEWETIGTTGPSLEKNELDQLNELITKKKNKKQHYQKLLINIDGIDAKYKEIVDACCKIADELDVKSDYCTLS